MLGFYRFKDGSRPKWIFDFDEFLLQLFILIATLFLMVLTGLLIFGGVHMMHR